ncbi:MAG: PEP-CTERM sorting domain-containing protein [Nostoc sp.]|uniref:PEP-CTERM sorting domain-containing protein n=1 Tax=Nostoc sp. TaxID=1180 RepID=UPI002FFB8324
MTITYGFKDMLKKGFLFKLGCVVALTGTVLMPTTAKASNIGNTQTLIDWDQLASGWTPPQSGQVRSFQAGAGTVDLKFDLGSDIKFASFGGSGLTPAISSTLNGSQDANDKSLHLQIDASAVGLTKGANSLTMTTSFKDFSSPLTDVTFKLFDVDISNNKTWQDRVILKGFLGNQVVNPIFSPFLTQGNTIQQVDAYTIDGIGFDSDATNGDYGTVLVKFASAIDRFELVFTDGDDIGTRNPDDHGIGIGDIKYTASSQSVPEPASILGLLVLGTFGASSVLKRKQ